MFRVYLEKAILVLIGTLISSIGWYFAYTEGRKSSFEVGYNYGSLDARSEIVGNLANEFDYPVNDKEYLHLFSVKATSVVIIEREGVKTIAIMR